MVHIIPLFVGERRLDTGNAVQYPDSSPVGEAMQQFGDRWQAAAERYEQRKAQQQAFDTEIAARRLNGELAKAEAGAVANAPPTAPACTKRCMARSIRITAKW